jgi:hypothetical protein
MKFRPPVKGVTRLNEPATKYLYTKPAEPVLGRVRGNHVVSAEFHERQLADIAAGCITYQQAFEEREW